jgi:hypothetical protein
MAHVLRRLLCSALEEFSLSLRSAAPARYASLNWAPPSPEADAQELASVAQTRGTRSRVMHRFRSEMISEWSAVKHQESTVQCKKVLDVLEPQLNAGTRVAARIVVAQRKRLVVFAERARCLAKPLSRRAHHTRPAASWKTRVLQGAEEGVLTWLKLMGNRVPAIA